MEICSQYNEQKAWVSEIQKKRMHKSKHTRASNLNFYDFFYSDAEQMNI